MGRRRTAIAAADHLKQYRLGKVRLILGCLDRQHQSEPDPAEMAEKYGAATPVRDWVSRLVCSQCGARDISFVLTGARR